MKIYLLNWQSCPDYDGKRWISRLKKYGVDYSRLIELPSAKGLNQEERNLVFLFKEPKTIIDVTVIGYGGCYPFADSTAGYFYTNLKKNVPEEQFDNAVEMLNPDYILEVAKAVFGFDEDRPLWVRKEALKQFLVANYSTLILK